MAKLRKPPPFSFASAREKRAHQIRNELHPSMGTSKTPHFNARLERSSDHQPGRYDHDNGGEAGGDSTANEAFFRDQEERESEEQLTLGKMKAKTPAMRLKKKAKSLDLDVLDGLIKPPARPRMRIRSLNIKRQTSPSGDDATPAQKHLAVDLRLALLFAAAYTVFLLMLYPSATLDLTFIVLMAFAPFPEWMPWWTALIAMMLPMGLRAKFEVTLFLCGAVWLGGLEWGDAWRRVGRWVREG